MILISELQTHTCIFILKTAFEHDAQAYTSAH
jgi:hypothetical protein